MAQGARDIQGHPATTAIKIVNQKNVPFITILQRKVCSNLPSLAYMHSQYMCILIDRVVGYLDDVQQILTES